MFSTPNSPFPPDTPQESPDPNLIPVGGDTPSGFPSSSTSRNGGSDAERDEDRKAFRVPSSRGPEGSPLPNYRVDPYHPAGIRERELP